MPVDVMPAVRTERRDEVVGETDRDVQQGPVAGAPG
jgi:hypothetical protein